MTAAPSAPPAIAPTASRGSRIRQLRLVVHASDYEQAVRFFRRAVYQLWYLLIHVNLFGGGYGAQTAGVLREALAG